MDHKDLEVWKKSMDLVVKVYQITKLFPDTEKYGLTSQMRRAAVSIPSNIAEGATRKGDKELIQFLYISIGVTLRGRNSIFNCDAIRICYKRGCF